MMFAMFPVMFFHPTCMYMYMGAQLLCQWPSLLYRVFANEGFLDRIVYLNKYAVQKLGKYEQCYYMLYM